MIALRPRLTESVVSTGSAGAAARRPRWQEGRARGAQCLWWAKALLLACFLSAGPTGLASAWAAPGKKASNQALAQVGNERAAAANSATLHFLAALNLQRVDGDSVFCHRLFAQLDETLDELVDGQLWHRVLQLFVQSSLPGRLRSLRLAGCNDDLGQSGPRESGPCCELREQALNAMLVVETAPAFVELVQQPALQRWLAAIALGEQAHCLSEPTL